MRRLLLALSLLATPAAADPDRWSILMRSAHIAAPSSDNGGARFNQFNPGVFLTWDRVPFDWSVGAYLSSYDRIMPTVDRQVVVSSLLTALMAT